ncbi:MAG: hypothetical protein RI562_08405 [Salibacter sp.]|uniref:hypothetical protein n=1 Tax=Salibacter sp. TaxID=2010995 RepID=UPI0028705C8D|nr:hypothetical protein [Salibacter sp.]MDR9399070.1 hypothetical protein [Salibacter sp.]
MRTFLKYIIPGIVVLWSFSCGNSQSGDGQSQNQPTDSAKVENKQQPDESKGGGVMRKESELAAWMKNKHDQLAMIREKLEKGESIPDSINWNWEAIYTAQRTDEDASGETFDGMAQAFLTEMKKTVETGDVKSYNHAVRSCVNCHENYCPGPISKIQRLKITDAESM